MHLYSYTKLITHANSLRQIAKFFGTRVVIKAFVVFFQLIIVEEKVVAKQQERLSYIFCAASSKS